jgi:hypothetical protein
MLVPYRPKPTLLLPTVGFKCIVCSENGIMTNMTCELHDFQVEFKLHRCQLELAATLVCAKPQSQTGPAQREINGSLSVYYKRNRWLTADALMHRHDTPTQLVSPRVSVFAPLFPSICDILWGGIIAPQILQSRSAYRGPPMQICCQ